MGRSDKAMSSSAVQMAMRIIRKRQRCAKTLHRTHAASQFCNPLARRRGFDSSGQPLPRALRTQEYAGLSARDRTERARRSPLAKQTLRFGHRSGPVFTVRFADLLREHWSEYVARAGGLAEVPAVHRRAVEAVLSCRTPRWAGTFTPARIATANTSPTTVANHRACPCCCGEMQLRGKLRPQKSPLIQGGLNRRLNCCFF